jgi:hypothetical protein
VCQDGKLVEEAPNERGNPGVEPGNERNKVMAQAAEERFDITDGKNRYRPCPECGATLNMGLVHVRSLLCVQCAFCGFAGPGIPDSKPCWQNDKKAFDYWNALPGSRLLAALEAADRLVELADTPMYTEELEQQLRDAVAAYREARAMPE